MIFNKLIKGKLRFIILAVILFAAAFLLFDYAAKSVYPVKYKDFILKYSLKENLDPYLVLAVIKVESNFNPEAVSPRNARGLMQISLKTGQWGARNLKLGEYGDDSLFDPETNIEIGCWYLDVLMKEYGDNSDLVLAAYNGGSGNVNTWLKDKNLSSTGKTLDRIPFRETETYLKKVKKCYNIYKRLYENII